VISPAPTVIPPAPMAATNHGATMGGGCGSCCEASCCDEGGRGHRLLARLRALFRRSDCCDSGCDSCGGHSWARARQWGGSCGCDTGCSSCDEGCGHRLFGRLRGLFNRGGDCCASDCGGGCGGGGCGGCGSTSGVPAHGAPYGAPAYGAPLTKPAEQIMTKPGEAKPMPSTPPASAPGAEKKSELNPAPRLVPAPRTNLTVESTNPF
jgi:hypothetical protein